MPTQLIEMRATNLRIGNRASGDANPSVAQLAAEIRRYCDAHPDARDSIDGIAWWVTWQRFSATKENLQIAIDKLVAGGHLQSHRLNDGSVVFGCGETPTKAPRMSKTGSHVTGRRKGAVRRPK